MKHLDLMTAKSEIKRHLGLLIHKHITPNNGSKYVHDLHKVFSSGNLIVWLVKAFRIYLYLPALIWFPFVIFVNFFPCHFSLYLKLEHCNELSIKDQVTYLWITIVTDYNKQLLKIRNVHAQNCWGNIKLVINMNTLQQQW